MSLLDCSIHEIPELSGEHSHAHAHILLPLTEHLDLRLDGKTYRITSSHLSFVPPGTAHYCMRASDVLIINIPRAMIKEADEEVLSSNVCLCLTGNMVPLVNLIKSEVRRCPGSNSIVYLYYYLYDMLVEAGSIRSLNYIRDHFDEEISVSQLAALENYSEAYYFEWFRQQTGTTPYSYLKSVRADKARELLVSTAYRLTDIAAQTGYGSAPAFSRAFKDVTGMSPNTYRQKYGAGD